MMAPALSLLLLAVVVAVAAAGPVLVRRAEPMLARTPRLAVGLLLGTVATWLAALLALGPLSAWWSSDAVMLPGRAGRFCQQCVAASNPFAADLAGPIPAAVALAVPVVLVAAVVGALGVEVWRSVRRARRLADGVRSVGRQVRLSGRQVVLVDVREPVALAMPGRPGLVVVSPRTREMLTADELAAVLIHEETHLRQRHHLVMTVVTALDRVLGRVPLVAAVTAAVPQYLEIAADRQACREVGPTAVIGALAALGGHGAGAFSALAPAEALHMSGSARVRSLVLPRRGSAGAGFVAALVGVGLVVGVMAAAVAHVPVATALLAACA